MCLHSGSTRAICRDGGVCSNLFKNQQKKKRFLEQHLLINIDSTPVHPKMRGVKRYSEF